MKKTDGTLFSQHDQYFSNPATGWVWLLYQAQLPGWARHKVQRTTIMIVYTKPISWVGTTKVQRTTIMVVHMFGSCDLTPNYFLFLRVLASCPGTPLYWVSRAGTSCGGWCPHTGDIAFLKRVQVVNAHDRFSF